MNFLAHFQLAWPDTELLAGALEGDYRKGPLRGELPAGIERGVRLHRAIDAYTDHHPRLARLRRTFPADLRRYTGILADLSFDHFLCLHWSNFADIPRRNFNRAVYARLESRLDYYSAGARRMFQRMVEVDLLDRYARWESVTASAAYIGERLRRDNPLRDAGRALAPHRDALEQAFVDFYPELVDFSECQRRRLN